MKTNSKKKIVASALAVAMGAALVGSISGSVAWYQYSTRTTASFEGTSVGASRNLQISLDGSAWGHNITDAQIKDKAVAGDGTNNHNGQLAPVTPKFTDGKISGFYGHPVYQYFTGTPELSAENAKKQTLQFDLYFKSVDENDALESGLNIYLTYFDIKAVTVDGKADVTDALRIEISSADKTYIVSKQATPTTTTGKLDLNGNGVLDHGGAEFLDADDIAGTETAYVIGDESYATVLPTALKVDDSDPYAFKYNSAAVDGSNKIVTTGSAAVKVTVKVWLEGWAELANQPTGVTDPHIWSHAKYNGAKFAVDMRFACEAEAQ